MFDSLLWLPSSQYRDIETGVVDDLNLLVFYRKLTEMSGYSQGLIDKLCMDEDTITYRQDILEDFMNNQGFIEDLELNLRGFYHLQSKNSQLTEKLSNFYYLIDLVITVETSIRCIEDLQQTLLYYKPVSKGLRGLLENVEHILEAENFQDMKKDLKGIKQIFTGIKGLEVSINMSPVMRAYEAQVTGITDYPYRYPKVFRRIGAHHQSHIAFMGSYLRGYDPLFSLGKVHLDLMDEMEYALRDHKEVLLTFLEQYKKLDTEPFVRLLEEIVFYKASCDVLKPLRDKGLPLCRPKLVPSQERRLTLETCYNLALALHDLEGTQAKEEIVYNHIALGEEGRIIILTGANRGGKTTITQAIGQIQILAQLGLMVPASKAVISIVDGVYTHFPVLENETVNLGRFGKECKGFYQIFKKATKESLLLLNESFSGTSYLESLKVAEEVVKAVKYRGIRMVYNTHLHELAGRVCPFNERLVNDTPVISLVTGYEKGCNTYKVYPGNPEGISHGVEIAKMHQVTYEQLLERLEGRA